MNYKSFDHNFARFSFSRATHANNKRISKSIARYAFAYFATFEIRRSLRYLDLSGINI